MRPADGRTGGRAARAAGILVLVAASGATAQQPERVTAIRNVTVVPVVGDTIRNGTVVVRGGKIAAVGREVAVPAGARAIDGTGLFLYPGMIDSHTQLGLTEIQSVPGGNDTREIGDFNPQNLALSAVNPHSELIPVTRVNGVTSAITAAEGGLVSGYAALMDLAGWTTAEMGVAPRAGMVVNYPRVAGGRFGGRRGGSQEDAGAQVNRQVTQLTDYFRRAREYRDAKQRVTAAGGRLERPDAAMEAMIPVLDGTVPVVFDAGTAGQIRGALAVADSFGLRPIIRGGQEAWQLADELARRKVPVIVGPTTEVPGDDDPYDMVYANPGVLAQSGVVIAFRTNSAADSRNLPYNVALALAYGLDPGEALRAVTINPARIWGVADRLGSIEAGKVANLMLTTGDPLDVRTEVKQVFIRGEAIPMTDRHTELYQQFKARPR
ncbi:MAG TPA: amidohydrolase family protein [Gemmatimonadales bacterium]